VVYLEHTFIWELALFTSSGDRTSLYLTNIFYSFISYIKHGVPDNLETATIFTYTSSVFGFLSALALYLHFLCTYRVFDSYILH